MAFTTINGATATDRVTFEGTDGVDILTTFSTLTAFVGAQGANDNITATNVNGGLVDWQLKAGAGNDNVTFRSAMVGGRVNGNAGSDVIELSEVVDDAAVFGGQNNDAISTNTVANSRINGNLGDDVISVGIAPTFTAGVNNLNGTGADVLFASIFGGQGGDTINISTTNIQSSVIDGNLGSDRINLFYDFNSTVDAVTVNGGEGDDTIVVDGLTSNVNGTGAGISFDGGEGNDRIKAGGRNDTISGGAGNDRIDAGAGADQLTGGLGLNIFEVELATDTWVAGTPTAASPVVIEATDLITDWKAASDQIGFTINGAAAAFNAYVANTRSATLLAAINNAGEGVSLVAVGASDDSVTAYAVLKNGADVGAIQLGAEGIYRTTNIGAVMNANSVTGFTAII